MFVVRLNPYFVCILLLLLLGCEGGKKSETQPSGIYPVKEGNAYGYIDATGKRVIPSSYSYAMAFSEGLGAVNVGGSGYHRDMPENGKWGFIDIHNRLVINPKYFSPPVYAAPFNIEELSLASHDAYVFSEGLAPVINENNEWQYINARDSVIISGLDIRSARRFSEGLAAVYIHGKWGYIDIYGNMAIPPQYLFPADFKEGHCFVVDADMNTYCIDRSGKRAYPQYRLTSSFKEGNAPVKGGFRGEKFNIDENLKMGLIDTTGFLSAKAEFDIVRPFGSGLAPALVGSQQTTLLTLRDDYKTLKIQGGKWGFIDAKGSFIINPEFEDVKSFNHGLAAVKQGALWGYINSGGSWVFEPQFRWAGDFDENGVAKVILGENYHNSAGKNAYLSNGKIIWMEP
jgi:hypothetical protein